MRKIAFITLLLAAPASADIKGLLTYPGGSDGDVQYNCDYLFCAESAFTYNDTTNTLTVSTASVGLFQLTTGASNGYLLMSDASGFGAWTSTGSVRVATATYADSSGGGGVTIGANVSNGGVSGGILYEDASGDVAQHSGLTYNGTTTTFSSGWLAIGDASDGGNAVGNITIFSNFVDGEEPSIQFVQNLFGNNTVIGKIFNDPNATEGDANALVIQGDNNLAGQIVVGGTSVLIEPGLNLTGDLTVSGNYVGTINAEASGTVLTTVSKVSFLAAGCNNATAAPAMDLPTSNAPAAACRTGSNFQKGVLDFDSGTDESAYFGFLLPSDWTGNIDASFVWSSTTTATDDVVWGIQVGCAANNESDDPSLNTASTVTDAYGGTSGNKVMTAAVTGLTTTGCAASEWANFRVYRDADNGSDDLGGDARLIAVELTMRRAQ